MLTTSMMTEAFLREAAAEQDGTLASLLLKAAEDLAHLRAEVLVERQARERAETALKLVQSHAKHALDALPERYDLGLKHGRENSAKMCQVLEKENAELRRQMADENANFTREIIDLESRLDQVGNNDQKRG